MLIVKLEPDTKPVSMILGGSTLSVVGLAVTEPIEAVMTMMSERIRIGDVKNRYFPRILFSFPPLGSTSFHVHTQL